MQLQSQKRQTRTRSKMTSTLSLSNPYKLQNPENDKQDKKTTTLRDMITILYQNKKNIVLEENDKIK